MAIDQDRRSRLIAKYLRQGLALLPIVPAQKGQLDTGKAPLTRNGYKGASTSRWANYRFFKNAPEANVAVATGEVSKLLVLDIDPRHGGDKTLAKLEEMLGPLPATWRSRTSRGGQHIFFHWPADLKLIRDSTGKLLGPGLDVLGNASYAILPPSVHATGHVYRWRDKKALRQRPARLPEKWRAALTKRPSARATRPAKAAPTPLHRPIKDGSRNDTLFRLAAAWRAGGAHETELLEQLRKVNGERCQPPLEDEELATIAQSAASYANPSEKLDLANVLAESVLADKFSNGDHLIHLAGRFYRFGGTCWEEMNEEKLKKLVLGQIRGLKKRAHLKVASLMGEVTAILRANQEADTDIFAERTDPLPVINCQNGELWLGPDGKPDLRPHNPTSGQRHTLPVRYDPAASCPEYDQALDQIFSNAKDKDGLVRHWHELVGYLIQPTRQLPCIVVLLGEGANGKTKLLNTVTRLLGPQATFFGNVDQLENNRFSLGALRGKLLFVDDDVKIRLKLPDGVLKKISEAKPITGEEKFKNPVTFTSRAVPFLLCNGVPFLQDVTPGMVRRLHIIPFDKSFVGEERDTMLFERIWAKELPGILNRSLEGWSRLQKRGDFEIPKDAKQELKTWLVQANPLSAFVEECVTTDVQGRIKLREVYDRFRQWAKDSGIVRGLSMQALAADLQNLGFTIKKSNGDRRVYGLKLR